MRRLEHALMAALAAMLLPLTAEAARLQQNETGQEEAKATAAPVAEGTNAQAPQAQASAPAPEPAATPAPAPPSKPNKYYRIEWGNEWKKVFRRERYQRPHYLETH